MKKPIGEGLAFNTDNDIGYHNLRQSDEINNPHLTPEEIKGGVLKHLDPEKHWFDPVNPFNAPVEPLHWIIDQFAAKGMITLLGGVAGSGKSILIQYLLQLREDQTLINTAPGKAIYLTGLDSSETEIRRRAKSIGAGAGLLTVEIPDEIIPFLNNERFFNDLKDKIIEHDVDIIVFDTLADFHFGNLYDAAEANETMKALRKLASYTEVAIIIITHTRKSAEAKVKYQPNDIADSRIFATKSDFLFAIKNEYQADETNLIEIQCLKSRSPRPMAPLKALVEYDESMGRVHVQQTDRPFLNEADALEERKKIQERRKQAYEMHQKGESKRAIAEHFGVSHTTINKDLKAYEKIIE